MGKMANKTANEDGKCGDCGLDTRGALNGRAPHPPCVGQKPTQATEPGFRSTGVPSTVWRASSTSITGMPSRIG
ncbi:hypothetical protein LMG24238_02647 [Paraburkholderia sediminicola]|uniref:Uncharacterized protein n=1 Tax=Paraburkholderia sediminicola TaxID=458836 RepID=A0A6J5AXL7_9BURK|nr:hypothetical protein LMG24238_02647 [Paraburkholderia sediminicola]